MRTISQKAYEARYKKLSENLRKAVMALLNHGYMRMPFRIDYDWRTSVMAGHPSEIHGMSREPEKPTKPTKPKSTKKRKS